jgi:uncharacterized protein (TIGR03435 family)
VNVVALNFVALNLPLHRLQANLKAPAMKRIILIAAAFAASAPGQQVAAGAGTPYDIRIAPAPKNEPQMAGQGNADQFVIRNLSLKAIIGLLWQQRVTRISFPKDLDKDGYDVTAHIPEGSREQMLQAVRGAVLQRFGLTAHKATLPQTVYVLRTGEHPSSQFRPAKEGEFTVSGGGKNIVMGSATPVAVLANAFEDILETPVIDETGLSGNYDYSAATQTPPPQSAFEMARQLGLEFTQAERPIEMLVVEKRQ